MRYRKTMARIPQPKKCSNKHIVDNKQHASKKRETKRFDTSPVRSRRAVDRPEYRGPIHIPKCILISGNIKFGYFGSPVVPSSVVAKEYIIGGPRSGSLA